jgi:hypothetical protein
MKNSIRLAAEPIRTVAFGGIGAAYAVVGTPITEAVEKIILQNNTDASVFISINGVNDHLFLPNSGQMIIDGVVNDESGLFTSQGTQFWIRRAVGAPSTGSFYLSVIYGARR